jgi:hypothetical protein
MRLSIPSAGAVAAVALMLAFAGAAEARPRNNPGQTFVPGHYAWNARTQQYVWVPSHWERASRTANVGWTFSGGRWQFTPGR